MNYRSDFARRALRSGAALRALALLGAGAVGGLSTPAVAQDYSQVNATGRIQGTDGKPLAGASVTVTSNAQNATRTVTTGPDGTYRVPALQQGSYTFTIAAPGFTTFTDPEVTLSQAGAANQFTLAAEGGSAATASAGTDIVVTAGRRQTVDFDRNTTGAVINLADLATRLPVARDITSVILLAPGTQLGDPAFGSVPQIAGSSVSENTFYINGLNITNFTTGIGANTVPFDFYQTVEVKTGGISAEFGRFTGGFVNATTKSGSNQFHGGITFNWLPDALLSLSPNTYAADNDSVYSERREMIAQLSGPIIKDHLFFYAMYNSRNIESSGGVTTAVSGGDPTRGGTVAISSATRANSCFFNPTMCSATYPGPVGAGSITSPAGVTPATYGNLVLAGSSFSQSTTNTPFYGAKIDAIIVEGQRVELTYFNTQSRTTRDTFGNGTFTLASGDRYNPNTNKPGRYASTSTTRTGGENYVARYTGTFTDWLTVSGAYGRAYQGSDSSSSTPNLSSIVDQRAGTANSVGNPTSNSTFEEAHREFYRGDIDLYFKLAGSHHIRAGYDRENLTDTSNTRANGNYQLTYLNSGAAGDGVVTTPNTQYVTRRYFGNGGTFSTTGEAFYLQDSWSLLDNRVNLNLGVRDDRFVNRNADGAAFFKSGNNYAPRLSIGFDPIGNGQTKVFASFDRYFLPIATNTNVRLAGPELDYTQYYALNSVNSDNTPVYGGPIAISGASASACPALAIEQTPGNVRNCTVNNDGTSPPFDTLVSTNLKAQSLDEYQLGIEQRVGSLIKFKVYYTQRDLRVSLEDAYIDAGVAGYCNATASLTAAQKTSCLATFSGAHQYALINPGKDVIVTLDGSALDGRQVTLTAADLNLPKAVRQYRAMTFTFDREFDGKWSLGGSYTLSTNIGNIEGGVRSDNGQSDSGLTTNFDYPALVNGAYGYLPTHNLHNIKAYGTFVPVAWLTLGANLQVTSPRKYGCLGRVPNSIDGGKAGVYGAAGFYCNVVNGQVVNNANGFTFVNSATTTTEQLTPRGSILTNDWQTNIGLDATVRIPTDAFVGFVRVSVFNVLNRSSVFDLQEIGTTSAGTPSPNYGLPLTYQAPRSFRLQLGVNF